MSTRPAPQPCSGCRDGAVFEQQFSMAFQPIVDVEAGTVFAYEALVRGPEGQGAMTVLGAVTDANRYAFDQKCRVRAIETALAAGLMEGDAKLSINFLPNAVYSPLACIQLTLKTAAANKLPVDRLIFEFTENEVISSPDHIQTIVDAYRRMGFGVAIDDFGAGSSGLDLFAELAPDTIKLDMALVRGIDCDRRRQAIVRGVVGIARELDTRVVGEGVETRGEAETLRDLGVRLQQGYLHARPAFEALPRVAF